MTSFSQDLTPSPRRAGPHAAPGVRHADEGRPRILGRPSAHALKLVRTGCLVVPLGGDRPLARACVELLRAELPSMHPTLDVESDRIGVIWACGYRPGAQAEVQRLRERHPEALLVVTGRSIESDRGRLRAVGADRVIDWPASMSELREALRSRRVRA